ncbi:MAG: hypothetical protein LBV00_09490 [Propionibacteriaceae bacterium]|jgi:hypothetical protein|nr:hypothetical protein [Propionibacteriaceae bacterium]
MSLLRLLCGGSGGGAGGGAVSSVKWSDPHDGDMDKALSKVGVTQLCKE